MAEAMFLLCFGYRLSYLLYLFLNLFSNRNHRLRRCRRRCNRRGHLKPFLAYPCGRWDRRHFRQWWWWWNRLSLFYRLQLLFLQLQLYKFFFCLGLFRRCLWGLLTEVTRPYIFSSLSSRI